MTPTIPTTMFAGLALFACGGEGSTPPAFDADGTDGIDAALFDAAGGDAAMVGLPTWMLEDVQPVSPRFGQTYGVDTFNGKIIVVTLLEGF
jgi:hypothetical protein